MKRIQASRYVGGSVRRRRIPAPPAADTGAALAQRKAEVASLFAELWAESLAGRSGEAPAEAATAAPEEPAAALVPVAPSASAGEAPRSGSLFVDHTVRSGQSITFPEGDVTVIGSVSSGAEIVAGGSIHVYGALRGRALAGVGGNPEARIICHSLEAELLVIDGLYRVADEIDPALRNRPAQIRLEGAAMTVTALD